MYNLNYFKAILVSLSFIGFLHFQTVLGQESISQEDTNTSTQSTELNLNVPDFSQPEQTILLTTPPPPTPQSTELNLNVPDFSQPEQTILLTTPLPTQENPQLNLNAPEMPSGYTPILTTPRPSESTVSAPLSGKTFHIKNTYGGSSHKWYGALLSWDGANPHPMATVEKNDPVKWKFEAVSGKANTYKIVNTYPGQWNGASISWDNKNSHPMISVEFNDPVEWRMDPVPGKANHYKIVNTYAGQWQGASISWDDGSSYPMASLEFNDPVEWELVPVK